jgi:filamentous hemagglutinin
VGKGRSSNNAPSTQTMPEPDYSTPHAPYSLRVDPITGKGPMHVDSRDFTRATSYTVEGAPRNKDQFWKMWAEKYPETLSNDNLKLIRSGQAPVVDNQWLKHLPEHQRYLDDSLVHHHIDHTHLTTGLPDELHRTRPGRSMFHSNLGGTKK